MKHIRKLHGDWFCISVSGYPEGHPNAITKIDAEKVVGLVRALCVVLCTLLGLGPGLRLELELDATED